ncbi:MAG TPA: FCD domain-containing protein [Firmicutes bacterium]|nr:FCD domain-containing protein [Bacillota bacterium]
MIKKKSLVQQVADDIYKMITEDKIFAPGEQLPNENTLSSRLGVSRATLREAIRILAAQGVLDVYRGRGTFISPDIYTLNDIGLESMERVRVHLKDLYEARLLFEPEIASIVCRRASDAELKKIFEVGAEVEKVILAGKDRTEMDSEFHKILVKASHNEFLQRLFPIIDKSIQEAIKLNGCKLPSEDLLAKDTLRDHALLMEFLKKRDAVSARNAMSIHLHHIITNLNINSDDEPIF